MTAIEFRRFSVLLCSCLLAIAGCGGTKGGIDDGARTGTHFFGPYARSAQGSDPARNGTLVLVVSPQNQISGTVNDAVQGAGTLSGTFVAPQTWNVTLNFAGQPAVSFTGMLTQNPDLSWHGTLNEATGGSPLATQFDLTYGFPGP